MFKIVFSELWYHQRDPLFSYNEGEIYINHAYLLVSAFFYFCSFSLITSYLFFFNLLKMLGIWLFVSLPLSVAGTIFGRHWMGKYEAPCRVNSIPR